MSCSHLPSHERELAFLAEGSEHAVFLSRGGAQVFKLTRPGTYGEYYELVEGRVHQFAATPSEYLLRMQLWRQLFGRGPTPVGITETGQIVTRQKFIRGEIPEQTQVDEFLQNAGLIAVRQKLWIWKQFEPETKLETWIGDVRSDNFVATPAGLIPIDIRLWIREP